MSAQLDSHVHEHGDETFHEIPLADQLELSRRALQLRDEKVQDSAWWKDKMEGYNATSAEVEDQMPRLMANLDRAIDGEHYALQGILAALHLIQRQAKAEAKDEAEAEVNAQWDEAHPEWEGA